jgi:hypothetical protein
MLYKALIKSVMTYACPPGSTWYTLTSGNGSTCRTEFSGLLENLDRHTQVCNLHVTSKISYIYDYINKLCRTKAEVILNNENPSVHGIEQGETIHREYKRLRLGSGQAYD